MVDVRGARLWVWLSPLIAALLLMGLAAHGAAAAPVPSQTGASATVPQAAAGTAAAERAAVQARLVGVGLTESAAAGRVALLTEEEVHAIAAGPDALQSAGGASTADVAAGTAFALLILYGCWLVYTHG